MLGTAFPASRLLLVEQPGPWGRAGLPASRFDLRAAHELIAAMNRRGVRVLAIRRPGRTVSEALRRWCFVDCRPRAGKCGLGALRHGRRADPARRRRTRRGRSAQRRAGRREPFFAVCVHGTHDVCCAIEGRPVAAELERLRPGRVWECSHIGGDRFAANVLVLPSGVIYGRVDSAAAADLVDAADRGVVLPRLPARPGGTAAGGAGGRRGGAGAATGHAGWLVSAPRGCGR